MYAHQEGYANSALGYLGSHLPWDWWTSFEEEKELQAHRNEYPLMLSCVAQARAGAVQ